MSAVTFASKGYSTLDAAVVALSPVVSAGASLRWWDVLPKCLGLVKKRKEVVCEIKLELRLEFSGRQHILRSRKYISEAQHQTDGKSFHGFVGVSAAHDCAQQITYLLKFDVIVQLFYVLPLAELAHLSTTSLLKKGLKHIFKEGIGVLEYGLDGVDVTKEDGGKNVSHGSSRAHIGLLFLCVSHPVIDGIPALVSSE